MFKRGSQRSKQSRKYRQQMIEGLEERRLLTTLVGGGTGQARTYTYTSDGGTTPDTRITIYGNVIAEFIFMQAGTVVNPALNGTSIPMLVPPGGTSASGEDLFAIYVSKSDINSFISVTHFTSSGGIDPFAGAPTLVVNPAFSRGPDNTSTSGLGAAVLGDVVAVTNGVQAVVKTNINGAAIGVRPAGLDDLPNDPNNDLSAGLTVANGQDLGKFLFAGPVFGRVHVDGSMNLFYSGWLLTGDARGASAGTTSTNPTSLADGLEIPKQNFYVGGDLQNLVSAGAIGWDATYGTGANLPPFFLSGTDIYVRGRVGQIQSNAGSAATVTVANMDPATAGFTRPVGYQEEIEAWNHTGLSGLGAAAAGLQPGVFPNTPGTDFTAGQLIQPATGRWVDPFNNNSFNQFQLLNAFDSPAGNGIVDLLGSIDTAPDPNTDPLDWYGVPLMAGQTITVQLRSGTGTSHFGIYDPDQRLIAEDYNNVMTPRSTGQTGDANPAFSTYTYNQPIQFTADRPGIYRIAIGGSSDPDFSGAASLPTLDRYELLVTGMTPMALGALSVMDTSPTGGGPAPMVDSTVAQPAVQTVNGDLGAVYVGGIANTFGAKLYIPTAPPAPGTTPLTRTFGSIYVPNGNLRVLDVGTLNSGLPGTGFDLNVAGNVGLVQTRTGLMELNPSVVENFSTVTPVTTPVGPSTPVPFTPAQLAIGGSYQVIHAAASFAGGVDADGGMGQLRVGGDLTTIAALRSYINLDADNKNFDGKSDLIDVTGNFNGPILTHGPGGNFRYLRVGGTITADPFFGGNVNSRDVGNYGQTLTFTDDSGSTISLVPTGQAILNGAFNPQDPTAGPQYFQPQLSVQTYPVRSGGVIVMDVQSTQSLAVQTAAGSFNGTAEISRIEVHGNGAAPVTATRNNGRGSFTTTVTPAFSSVAQGNDESVTISGSAITDVAYIAAMAAETSNTYFTVTEVSPIATFNNLTNLSNSTGGEILSVHALNINTMRSTGPIGVTRTTTIPGNALNFITPLSIGAGYAARTDRPVDTGNVIGNTWPFLGQTYGIAVQGNIAYLASNQGVGNIASQGLIGTVVANADGRNTPGVFEGINAPIVGLGTTVNIAASSGAQPGSILAVNIGEGIPSSGSGSFARTGLFAANIIGQVLGNNADIRGTVQFGRQLQNLTLNKGSLIDANILNAMNVATVRESAAGTTLAVFSNNGVETNIPSININGAGQGIIGTLIVANTIGSINVPSGFGIISSELSMVGNGRIGSMTIGGYGLRDVRIDGNQNIGTINLTGNGKNLSTNAVTPSVRESESVRADPVLAVGIDPYSGRALTPLNDIHSALGTNQAAPVIQGVTDTGAMEDTDIVGTGTLNSLTAQTIRGPYTQVNFGTAIGTIKTRGLINGLQVISGKIKNFQPASDVLGLNMSISGPIDNLKINGSLGGNSTIAAIGPNGRIGTITIKKDLVGTIHAVESINTVTIGRNLTGSLLVDAFNRGGMALNRLQVGGTISNGALTVGSPGTVANVGTIQVGHSLGASSADTFTVSGSIQNLTVNGAMNLSLVVNRGIGNLTAQQINGPVSVGADLKNLLVKSGGLNGDLTVSNRLVNATVNGSVTGNISANNGIGTITINHGDFAAGKTIQTGYGNIDTIRINGGNLLGNVLATGGKIGQVIVSGNMGDGSTPLAMTSNAMKLLQIGRNINDGVTVTISGPLASLVVGNDIEAGAKIVAASIGKQKIGGQVFGSVVIG